MRRASITLALFCVTMGAQAGELEDVVACVTAAERFAGVKLDVTDATYQFRFLSRCTATWPNAVCEVDLGKVYNLKINDQDVIVEQFVGRDTFDLNRQLELETKAAIDNLRSRIVVLENRQTEVTECLRDASPNFDELTSYILGGIEQASSGGDFNSLGGCPGKATVVADETDSSSGRPPVSSSEEGRIEVQDDRDLSVPGSPGKRARGSPPQSPSAESGAAWAWVTSDRLNNRTCPATTCGVINVLFFRERVEIYERQGGWARITDYYDAGCQDGTSLYVIRGDARCVPSNGITDGTVARWVATQYLSDVRPLDPGAGATGDYALVKNSDDYRIHKEVFARAARQLINAGQCTTKDFTEGVQWNKSISHETQPIYFTYCGELRVENRIYLDARTGRTFR